MKQPRTELNPNATEAEKAAYWASLTKAQRIALLRSGNVLGVTRDEAQATRTARREWAKGV